MSRRSKLCAQLNMSGSTYYRLDTPTLAILATPDGHGIPVTIPGGAVLTVVGLANYDRMIDVFWDGKIVMIFTQDLRTRGVQIDSAPV